MVQCTPKFKQEWTWTQSQLRCPQCGRHFFLKVPNRYLRWAGSWCATGSCNVHCQRPSNMPCELKLYISSNDFLANSSKAYKLTSLQFAKKILIIYQWKIGILGEREVDVLHAAAMSIVKDRLICPVSWNRTFVAMIFWQTAIGEYKFTSLQFAKKYWLFINEKSVS